MSSWNERFLFGVVVGSLLMSFISLAVKSLIRSGR
jgi:hypothetical protein